MRQMRLLPPGIKTLTQVLDLLFPSSCPVCRSRSDSLLTSPVCASCWEEIEKHPGTGCRTCGAITSYDPGDRCQECRNIKPVFDRVITFGLYDGPLKEIIHAMKFRQMKKLALLLGRELAQLDLPDADVLVPVPLGRKGLRDREFNQAALMAKKVSEKTGIPLVLNRLVKIRETVPQSTLPAQERKDNVKNAYALSGPMSCMRVMLVDDIVTTGATVNECARVLRKAGAASVSVLAAARAVNR
ncbi:MAG: ComF family protein [bacterium]